MGGRVTANVGLASCVDGRVSFVQGRNLGARTLVDPDIVNPELSWKLELWRREDG